MVDALGNESKAYPFHEVAEAFEALGKNPAALDRFIDECDSQGLKISMPAETALSVLGINAIRHGGLSYTSSLRELSDGLKALRSDPEAMSRAIQASKNQGLKVQIPNDAAVVADNIFRNIPAIRRGGIFY